MTRPTEYVGFKAIMTLINDSDHANKKALAEWLYAMTLSVERTQAAMRDAKIVVQDGTPLAEMFKPA